MAITSLTSNVWPAEEGTLVLSGTFVDDAGDAATPTLARWSLLSDAGTVINSRSQVALSLASSYRIVLSGDDLAIGANGTARRILVEAQYDSDAGSGLWLRHEILFQIVNLVGVT